MEFLTVEDAVGEIADPVPQADHTAVFGDADIIGDMPVTEHKIFDVGGLFKLLSGKLKLVLMVHSPESAKRTMFLPAFF